MYQRLVNQHLSSARLLLEELSHQEDASLALRRAFEDAILHLLNSAYLCQLRAIADNYHCGNSTVIADVDTLLAALTVLDKPAPEAREIALLIDEGWLGELLKAQRQLCLPTSTQLFAPGMPAASQSDIALSVDSQGELALTVDQARKWLLALEELVQRQSEMMLEY